MCFCRYIRIDILCYYFCIKVLFREFLMDKRKVPLLKPTYIRPFSCIINYTPQNVRQFNLSYNITNIRHALSCTHERKRNRTTIYLVSSLFFLFYITIATAGRPSCCLLVTALAINLICDASFLKELILKYIYNATLTYCLTNSKITDKII